jgi:diacylglycerol kinase family enzyme
VSSKIKLVVNPVSANRSTGKEWPQIAARLKGIIGDFTWEFTTGPERDAMP